ncbi:MAG: hypothetical protein ACRD3C_20025 [Vicinamibacterales bacterium]
MQLPFSREVRRLAVTGVVCWALAAASLGTLRLTFGSRPVYVHVRWAAQVDDTTRHELERQYSLSQGELREGRTWGYALTDLSRGNIRALVGDRAVEDTHQIHRTAFRVGYFAPRLPYLTSQPRIPAGLEVLSALFFLAGAVVLSLAALAHTAPRMVRGPILGLRDACLAPGVAVSRLALALLTWTRARIPDASAESVALFRVVFGAALLMFVLRRPLRDAWATEDTDVLSSPHQLLFDMLRERPWLVEGIAPWIAFWGGLFIVGAFARTAFALTTLGVFTWATVYTTRTTYHTVSALLMALLCLLWSRWSDGWSVDAWLRRRDVRRGTPKEYGYTIWMPGLVLGVIFAAAAFAKLRESGLAWILNGTVKYHFLTDSGQAMVDWGLQLGRYHAVAVLLSFGAIAIESLVIVGVVSRLYRYRLAAGVSALCLLLGFALLQGVFWPGWWILLLSFLPWHLVAAPGSAQRASDEEPRNVAWRQALQPAIVAVTVGVVGVQLIVSLLAIEVSPLLSTYDMYSTTYASPAEYEQKAADAYWVVATDDAAKLHQCRINRVEADVIAAAASIPGDAGVAAQVARRCFAPSVRIRTIVVEGNRARVDWAQWRPGQTERVRLTDPIAIEP